MALVSCGNVLFITPAGGIHSGTKTQIFSKNRELSCENFYIFPQYASFFQHISYLFRLIRHNSKTNNIYMNFISIKIKVCEFFRNYLCLRSGSGTRKCAHHACRLNMQDKKMSTFAIVYRVPTTKKMQT